MGDGSVRCDVCVCAVACEVVGVDSRVEVVCKMVTVISAEKQFQGVGPMAVPWNI